MLGLPNYPQRSKAGIWRNPLAFPTGRRPSFDPTHIAAPPLNAPAWASAAVVGNNFLELPSLSAPTGTQPAYSTDGILGPVGVFNNNAFLTLTYPSSGAAPGVVAAIFRPTTSSPVAVMGQTYGISITSTSIFMSGNSQGDVIGVTVPAVLNVPFFFAASSTGSSGVTRAVAVNLNTGQIYTSTGLAGIGVAGNKAFHLGGFSGNSFVGSIAAAFLGQGYSLSLSQLLAWAQDPWSFWYPDPFNFDYVGSSVFAVTALFGGRIELLGSSKASLPAPIANDAGLSAIPAPKIELGAGLARAMAISGETVAGIATRASTPAEVAGAVAALRLAPIEAKASIAAARVAMVESIAAVTGVTRVAAEVSLAALGLARAAIESAAGSQSALRLDLESLGSLSTSAQVDLETVSSATTALLAQSLMALEWLGGVDVGYRADLELAQFPLRVDPGYVVQVARRVLVAAGKQRSFVATAPFPIRSRRLPFTPPASADFIVDENGNPIVDEDGNNLVWQ